MIIISGRLTCSSQKVHNLDTAVTKEAIEDSEDSESSLTDVSEAILGQACSGKGLGKFLCMLGYPSMYQPMK